MHEDFWITTEGLEYLQFEDFERMEEIRHGNLSEPPYTRFLELAHLLVATTNRKRILDALETKPYALPF